jgi:hypothetical protein
MMRASRNEALLLRRLPLVSYSACSLGLHTCRFSPRFSSSYRLLLHTVTHIYLVLTALLCSVSAAFVPASRPTFAVTSLSAGTTVYGKEVDSIGNNIAVKNLLESVERKGLLKAVASSGLLSKAQKAGVSLSKLEPLLALAADNPDILILVEASGPELLPILPTLVDLAPGALPLLALAVSVPPFVIGGAGVGALGAALYAVSAIPDDSVALVALQTFIVLLAVPLAGVSVVGAGVLGNLTK